MLFCAPPTDHTEGVVPVQIGGYLRAAVGPAATVRDGSRVPPSAGRSRHGEHPGARVSVAETLIGGACQQPRFAESDVRHSRRMMRSTLPGTDVYARDLDTPTPRARRCRFNTLTSTDGPITRIWSLPV